MSSGRYSGLTKVFGPKFNNYTKAVFEAANAGAASTGVVVTDIP